MSTNVRARNMEMMRRRLELVIVSCHQCQQMQYSSSNHSTGRVRGIRYRNPVTSSIVCTIIDDDEKIDGGDSVCCVIIIKYNMEMTRGLSVVTALCDCRQ